eukprot:1599499-Rhodomonas_salina.2
MADDVSLRDSKAKTKNGMDEMLPGVVEYEHVSAPPAIHPSARECGHAKREELTQESQLWCRGGIT